MNANMTYCQEDSVREQEYIINLNGGEIIIKDEKKAVELAYISWKSQKKEKICVPTHTVNTRTATIIIIGKKLHVA